MCMPVSMQYSFRNPETTNVQWVGVAGPQWKGSRVLPWWLDMSYLQGASGKIYVL